MVWLIGFIVVAVGLVMIGLVKTNDRRTADIGPPPNQSERRVGARKAGGAPHH